MGGKQKQLKKILKSCPPDGATLQFSFIDIGIMLEMFDALEEYAKYENWQRCHDKGLDYPCFWGGGSDGYFLARRALGHDAQR